MRPKQLNQRFFRKWSHDMAYVTGLFAADGSMIVNNKGGMFIEFTSTDREIISHIRSLAGSTHKVQIRDRGSSKWKIQYRLQIGSKKWFADLEKLGFTVRKSSIMTFPSVPRKYVGSFVRGYFDGDGCVYVSDGIVSVSKRPRSVLQTLFTSGSKPFLKGLHEVLLASGLEGGSLVSKNRGFELKFSRHDSVALYKIMYHNAEESQKCLARKRLKLEYGLRLLKLLRE